MLWTCVFLNRFIITKTEMFCLVITCMKQHFTTVHCTVSVNVFWMPTKIGWYMTPVLEFFRSQSISVIWSLLFCCGVERDPDSDFLGIYFTHCQWSIKWPLVQTLHALSALPQWEGMESSSIPSHGIRLVTSWSRASLSMFPNMPLPHILIWWMIAHQRCGTRQLEY